MLSAFVLEELVSGQVVQARMIGTNEQECPWSTCTRAVNGATTMVNRELVDRVRHLAGHHTVIRLPLESTQQPLSNLGKFQNRESVLMPGTQTST